MPFATGTLRLIAAASAPSARIHPARESAPASANKSRSGTPVHSLQDTRPCVCPHVSAGGVAPYITPLLPEHSRKWMRDTIGYRSSDATVKDKCRVDIHWKMR